MLHMPLQYFFTYDPMKDLWYFLIMLQGMANSSLFCADQGAYDCY